MYPCSAQTAPAISTEASRRAEGNDQTAADRHPDRLAIERIAALGVEQHGVDAEGRGIAEQAAHIVVVGDAAEHHDQRAGRAVGEQRAASGSGARRPRPGFPDAKGSRRCHPSPSARRHRSAPPRRGRPARAPRASIRFRRAGARRAHGGWPANPQDNLAFGDEMALAADQIALAHSAIGGDARIEGIADGNERADRTALKR